MSIEDRIQRLKGGTKPDTEKVKTDGLAVPKKNGGARIGSGRKAYAEKVEKRGIAQYIQDHFDESVQIQVTDPKTGKTAIVDRPRVVVVLQKLYEIGMKNGDPDALNKWLDRALGRPKQPAEENNVPVFNLQINIANILNRAYGDKDKPLQG